MKILVYIFGTIIGLPLGWVITKVVAILWNLVTNPVDRVSFELEQTGFAKLTHYFIAYFVGIAFGIGIIAHLFGVKL